MWNLSQEGKIGVDRALCKLQLKIPDEPTKITVREMAVTKRKKVGNQKQFDRITLFSNDDWGKKKNTLHKTLETPFEPKIQGKLQKET